LQPVGKYQQSIRHVVELRRVAIDWARSIAVSQQFPFFNVSFLARCHRLNLIVGTTFFGRVRRLWLCLAEDTPSIPRSQAFEDPRPGATHERNRETANPRPK